MVGLDRKRELKQQYKESFRPMGIICIKNIENGKIYIEKSPNIEGTFNKHKFQLELGGHILKELQKDWNTYGGEKFIFEVLEYLKPSDKDTLEDLKEELEIMEVLWLDKLKPYDERGYNKARKA
jgi:hypothetical protein